MSLVCIAASIWGGQEKMTIPVKKLFQLAVNDFRDSLKIKTTRYLFPAGYLCILPVITVFT